MEFVDVSLMFLGQYNNVSYDAKNISSFLNKFSDMRLDFVPQPLSVSIFDDAGSREESRVGFFSQNKSYKINFFPDTLQLTQQIVVNDPNELEQVLVLFIQETKKVVEAIFSIADIHIEQASRIALVFTLITDSKRTKDLDLIYDQFNESNILFEDKVIEWESRKVYRFDSEELGEKLNVNFKIGRHGTHIVNESMGLQKEDDTIQVEYDINSLSEEMSERIDFDYSKKFLDFSKRKIDLTALKEVLYDENV